MKKLLTICLALSIGAGISSCSVDSVESVSLSTTNVQDAKGGVNRNFQAHLSGQEEVHEVITKATGQAIFQLSKDGTELSYKLIVANIQNVFMAHIHIAPAGVNGPVVVWLYPSSPPAQLIPGRSSGILAEGVITAANLVPSYRGTFDDLIAAIRAGNTYVNVHTNQYPPGEIRGQIK
jgi:hypothetical protein